MKFILGLIAGIVITGAALKWYPVIARSFVTSSLISPLGEKVQKPLDEFTVIALRSRHYPATPIQFDETVETTSEYVARTFHFSSEGRRITGLAHVPVAMSDRGGETTVKFPVIVQLRGYVDPTVYKPGVGTKHSAEVFAKNGFISLAPDFVGFGGSDPLTNNIFYDRFETYTTALNLLASVSTLPVADASKIGIWGHSNGGQIALMVNEIIQKPIPTVLWAPVSKPFPYSILYYTDDAPDQGRYLRHELAKFESDYDVALYSLTNYLDWIISPVQIHHGSSDDAVPQKWSDALVKQLQANKQDVAYFVYPGADHDMKGSWDTVIARDVEFFKKYLK